MSNICCDLCAYWLPQFKECGNTHINKCINKEYFVKVERNCGTCEREIKAEVIDGFSEKLKKHLNEFDFWKYGISDGINYETRNYDHMIDKIAEQMKEEKNIDWQEENKLKQEAQEDYEKEFSYNQVYIQGYSNGYNNAINEFAKKIHNEFHDYRIDGKSIDYWFDRLVDEIAEKMKENKHGIYKNISI